MDALTDLGKNVGRRSGVASSREHVFDSTLDLHRPLLLDFLGSRALVRVLVEAGLERDREKCAVLGRELERLFEYLLGASVHSFEGTSWECPQPLGRAMTDSARSLRSVLFRSLQAVLAPLPVRWFKKVPGAAFVYTTVYRRLKPHGETEVECLGHRLHVHAHDEGIARQILVKGIYEAAESRFFETWLRPGMGVLDVGANFGYFTVLAARAVGEKGAVHAFEPEPGNFALLEKNLKTNGYVDRAHAHNVALGDAPGAALLFTDPANLGNPSLAKDNVPDAAGSVRVAIVTLDSMLDRLPKIDLLKMDVQGFEACVLAGARGLLERDRPTLLLEIWPKGLRRAGDDPVAFLEGLVALGYAMHALGDDGKAAATIAVHELVDACDRRADGEEFQNVLFVPRA